MGTMLRHRAAIPADPSKHCGQSTDARNELFETSRLHEDSAVHADINNVYTRNFACIEEARSHRFVPAFTTYCEDRATTALSRPSNQSMRKFPGFCFFCAPTAREQSL